MGVWNVPSDFASIQAAMDDSRVIDGDTLILQQGTHQGPSSGFTKLLHLKGDTIYPGENRVNIENGYYQWLGHVNNSRVTMIAPRWASIPQEERMICEGITFRSLWSYSRPNHSVIQLFDSVPMLPGFEFLFNRCFFNSVDNFYADPFQFGFGIHTSKMTWLNCRCSHAYNGAEFQNWTRNSGYLDIIKSTLSSPPINADSPSDGLPKLLTQDYVSVNSNTPGYGYDYGSWLYPWVDPGMLRGFVDIDNANKGADVFIYRADRDEFVIKAIAAESSGLWVVTGLDPTLQYYVRVVPHQSGHRPWAGGPYNALVP